MHLHPEASSDRKPCEGSQSCNRSQAAGLCRQGFLQAARAHAWRSADLEAMRDSSTAQLMATSDKPRLSASLLRQCATSGWLRGSSSTSSYPHTAGSVSPDSQCLLSRLESPASHISPDPGKPDCLDRRWACRTCKYAWRHVMAQLGCAEGAQIAKTAPWIHPQVIHTVSMILVVELLDAHSNSFKPLPRL